MDEFYRVATLLKHHGCYSTTGYQNVVGSLHDTVLLTYGTTSTTGICVTNSLAVATTTKG